MGNLRAKFTDGLRVRPKTSLRNVAFKDARVRSDLPRRRDLRSKAKRRKHLVATREAQQARKQTGLSPLFHALHFTRSPVVVLDDVAHGPDRGQVLVDPLRADVVQRLRRSGVSVGPCEVNGHLAADMERP